MSRNSKSHPSENGVETPTKQPRKPRGQTQTVRIFRMNRVEVNDPYEYFVFMGSKVKRHFQVDSDTNNPNPIQETDLAMMVRMGAVFPSRKIVENGNLVAKLVSTSGIWTEEAYKSESVIKLIAFQHGRYLSSIQKQPETPEPTNDTI